MQRLIIIAFVMVLATPIIAQDTLYTTGHQQLVVARLKETTDAYKFTYITADGKLVKTQLLKLLVDSVRYAKALGKPSKKTKPLIMGSGDSTNHVTDSFLARPVITQKIKKSKKRQQAVTDNMAMEQPPLKPWLATAALGVNLSNVLEFNSPAGTDKKSLGLNTSIDLGLNYKKEGKRLETTNELHWNVGLQKEGLRGGTYIQRVADNFSTLHDFSIGMGKKNRWNINLIAKFNTSMFTIFDGDYFKDVNSLGRVQGFLSPYDLTLSPGIKFQPNNYFRLSASPYSIKLTGVRNNDVTAKGLHITEMDADGNYKKFLFKRLGAEVNFWYDRSVKKWLTVQYRLSFSSDYFEKIGKNGLMNGLFITNFSLFKGVSLSHRAIVAGDFAGKILKPYYNQTVLLSYAKSF